MDMESKQDALSSAGHRRDSACVTPEPGAGLTKRAPTKQLALPSGLRAYGPVDPRGNSHLPITGTGKVIRHSTHRATRPFRGGLRSGSVRRRIRDSIVRIDKAIFLCAVTIAGIEPTRMGSMLGP
jgi:hypothetical protein